MGTTDILQERLEAARAAAVQGEAAHRARTTLQEAETTRLAWQESRQSALESEAKIRAAADQIDREVEAGRLRIQAALKEARREVEAVAAEAAQEIVLRLTGIKVDKDEVDDAIKLDLNC